MIPIIKVGFDLGLSKVLHETTYPMSSTQLAEPHGADPVLVARIARFLVANGMIDETSEDHYHGNTQTTLLADPIVQGALYHVFNVTMPANQVLPKYLKEKGYQNRTGGDAPFNMSQGTKLPVFSWEKAEGREDLLKGYHCFMSLPRPTEWFDVFPMQGAENLLPANKKIFVDVGGSTGHQCRRLLAKYPQLKGRVVLEDLPQVIQVAQCIEGCEFVGCDMFDGQPVQGAKYYYCRNVLHDWEDDQCIKVLKNFIPALGPDSTILLDGLVLPNTKAHWIATGCDMQMFMMHGSLERTVAQWTSLIDAAGLRIINIKWYNSIGANAIMEVALSCTN